MKAQIITSEEDLEDKSTETWETVGGYLLGFVFSEQMSRLQWARGRERESDINPYWPNRNCRYNSLEQ
jgi:hypothetical protein